MSTQGEGSSKGSSYSLSVCDTDKARRNFPGYEKHEYDTDLMKGCPAGTTETHGAKSEKKK